MRKTNIQRSQIRLSSSHSRAVQSSWVIYNHTKASGSYQQLHNDQMHNDQSARWSVWQKKI